MNKREINNEPVADILVRSSNLKGVNISGGMIPKLIDEIPIIAVAAACAKGVTTIKNAEELRVKESDRIATVTCEMRKLGVRIEELTDGMIIHGGTISCPAEPLTSHYDHRIAMSLAIACLKAENEITINNIDCIDTSFPKFYDILNALS